MAEKARKKNRKNFQRLKNRAKKQEKPAKRKKRKPDRSSEPDRPGSAVNRFHLSPPLLACSSSSSFFPCFFSPKPDPQTLEPDTLLRPLRTLLPRAPKPSLPSPSSFSLYLVFTLSLIHVHPSPPVFPNPETTTPRTPICWPPFSPATYPISASFFIHLHARSPIDGQG